MDRFGKNVVEINGEQTIIPREERCRTRYKTAEIMLLNTEGAKSIIHPYVSDEHYTEAESLLQTKKILWYNMFKRGPTYKFEDHLHYPTPFKVYLRNLLLDVNYNTIDLFMYQVRNGMFTLVTYLSSPPSVSCASSISGNMIEMKSRHCYVLKNIWKNSKIDLHK